MSEVKYPATHVAHWATVPINFHVEHDTALVTDSGGIVCNQVCSPEWAEYITRACNNHYQLVEALEGGPTSGPDFLEWISDRLVNVYGESENVDFVLSLRQRAKVARQTLSNAKGGNNE